MAHACVRPLLLRLHFWMAVAAAGRAAISHHHLGMIRKLALSSPRSLAPLMHHSHYLNYVEEYSKTLKIRKNRRIIVKPRPT